VILFLGFCLDHLGTFNHIHGIIGTNLNFKKKKSGLAVSSLGDTHGMTTTETPEKPEITTKPETPRNTSLTILTNLNFSFNDVFV
jgi:hypothetical protein